MTYQNEKPNHSSTATARARLLLAAFGAASLMLSGGCNQLMSQATGGRFIAKANVKIVNDSPRKICKVKASKDGEVVDDQALTGVGIEPGKHGTAQVDEKLGKVKLFVYSCAPEEMLLIEQEVALAANETVRVR